jgi:uncharacterized protein YbjT (DUF2867 family)
LFYYNRVKGQLEEDLKEIPFEALYIFRPSMLLGNRNEFRFGEALGKGIMKPLSIVLPGNMKPIHVRQVAACMLDKMRGEERGVHIVQSKDIRKYPLNQWRKD